MCKDGDDFGKMIEREIGRKLGGDEPIFRSCWNCNASHDYLKMEGCNFVIYCFVCGRIYHKGREICKLKGRKSSKPKAAILKSK
jgi:hypothetical protein